MHPPSDLYPIPIASRPVHPTPLRNRLLFGPVFLVGVLVINSIQAVFVPIGLLSRVWRGVRTSLRIGGDGDSWLERVYEGGVKGTKQMFGMLLILITVLFAPTTITLTSDSTIPLSTLLQPHRNGLTYLQLPKDLVIMSNHQSYLDWIFIWIIGYLSVSPPSSLNSRITAVDDSQDTAQGEEDKLLPSPAHETQREYHHGSRTLVILLKQSLKWLPIVGWGMQFYRFIFLARAWALDRTNLEIALEHLATRARSGAGLWLLIFPEGTITSDEERAKSVRYATKEDVPDFVNLLHPRSTGLLFIIRTLVPQIPHLKLLDITIGYPGVPRGGYAQEWYGLGSVFMKGIAPPSVHVHLRMVDLGTEDVPGVTSFPKLQGGEVEGSTGTIDDTAAADASADQTSSSERHAPVVASETDVKAFNAWLRGRWADKEALLNRFTRTGGFARRRRSRTVSSLWPSSSDGEADEAEDDEVEKRGLVQDKEAVIPVGLW